MLKGIGLIVKLAILSAIILVIGNRMKWEGKTVSDQVRMGLAHAEQSGLANRIKNWAETLIGDAKNGAKNQSPASRVSATGAAPEQAPAGAAGNSNAHDGIPSTERQKLKDLIKELNKSGN